MIKKGLYPKTPRINDSMCFTITEKVDGSNLGLFNLGGKLLIVQSNSIFYHGDINAEYYKGLESYINDNKITSDSFHEGSGVFGEWIGNSHLKYKGIFSSRFLIFAKARLEGDFESLSVSKLNYDRSLIRYAFSSSEIDMWSELVPFVEIVSDCSVEFLDKMYEEYKSDIGRNVEGFIIVHQNNTVEKYVRYKDGKFVSYSRLGLLKSMEKSYFRDNG